MDKKKRRWIVAIIIFIFLILWGCDMRLKTVTYTVKSEKVDKKIRIALITDLHGCRYGKNQKTLINAVTKEEPDIILLGGDIFDDNVPYEKSETTIKQLAEKYPCYYVTGNHEYWSNDVDTILGIVEKYGIKTLSGKSDILDINGQKINVCGVDDPDVVQYTTDGVEIKKQLYSADEMSDRQYFSVLLSHRPELVELYQEHDFDLVLCGHAHGGQWRIPEILNGLYAPNQGVFPKYAGGRYDFENQTMIVSRGLARESTLAPRIFNRPELVIVDIES